VFNVAFAGEHLSTNLRKCTGQALVQIGGGQSDAAATQNGATQVDAIVS
jgi:hypothetical protein